MNGRSWSEPGVDGSSPWIIEDSKLVLGQFNLVLIDIHTVPRTVPRLSFRTRAIEESTSRPSSRDKREDEPIDPTEAIVPCPDVDC